MSKFLTAREVAERYKLDIQQVYSAARVGLIPCIRIGRRLRFSLDQLLEWERTGGKALPGGWRKEA